MTTPDHDDNQQAPGPRTPQQQLREQIEAGPLWQARAPQHRGGNSFSQAMTGPTATSNQPGVAVNPKPGAPANRLRDRIMQKLDREPAPSGSIPTAVTAPEQPVPATPVQLAANQVLFTQLFECQLPNDLKDFAVTVYSDTDWDDLISGSIPDLDRQFVPDIDILYWAVYAVEKNKRLIVTGPPGTGKTTMVRYIAARTQRPYIRLNGMAGLEPADQIGGLQAKEGATYYAMGDAAIAAKYGALLALDEPFKNSAATNMCYMALAERENPKLLLYGHPDYAKRHLTPDPRFRLVLCDNVTGTGNDLDKYAATEVQDSAFLNRMSVNLRLDYLPPAKETEMLLQLLPEIPRPIAGMMVMMASELRQAWSNGQIEHPYSPRNLIEWGEAMLFCDRPATAFVRTYPYASETSETKSVIQAFWRDVGFTTENLPA